MKETNGQTHLVYIKQNSNSSKDEGQLSGYQPSDPSGQEDIEELCDVDNDFHQMQKVSTLLFY